MEGLGWLLIYAGLFYVMMRYGCGAHMVHGHHHHSHQGQGGTKHIDPVCGMEVATDVGYGKMHGGQLYRFCSRKCLDAFEAEPEKFLERKSDSPGGGT